MSNNYSIADVVCAGIYGSKLTILVNRWAQFMRDPDRTSFIMLDTPGTSEFALDWN